MPVKMAVWKGLRSSIALQLKKLTLTNGVQLGGWNLFLCFFGPVTSFLNYASFVEMHKLFFSSLVFIL